MICCHTIAAMRGAENSEQQIALKIYSEKFICMLQFSCPINMNEGHLHYSLSFEQRMALIKEQTLKFLPFRTSHLNTKIKENCMITATSLKSVFCNDYKILHQLFKDSFK